MAIMTIDSLLIRQVVEIERENHFLNKISREFDESFVYNDIAAHHRNYQKFIIKLDFENVIVTAFLRYKIDKFNLHITSFQFRKNRINGGVFRFILRMLYLDLTKLSLECVKSEAYCTNFKSINLHLRLGFKKYKEDNIKVFFSTPFDMFIGILSNYI